MEYYQENRDKELLEGKIMDLWIGLGFRESRGFYKKKSFLRDLRYKKCD